MKSSCGWRTSARSSRALNLIPELDVEEDIFLDRQFTAPMGRIDWTKLYSETAKLLDSLGIRGGAVADVAEIGWRNLRMDNDS